MEHIHRKRGEKNLSVFFKLVNETQVKNESWKNLNLDICTIYLWIWETFRSFGLKFWKNHYRVCGLLLIKLITKYNGEFKKKINVENLLPIWGR